jgi:hypothetical protein
LLHQHGDAVELLAQIAGRGGHEDAYRRISAAVMTVVEPFTRSAQHGTFGHAP